MVWRVGTRYADVRIVFAEFLVIVPRFILRNSKGNDQVFWTFLGCRDLSVDRVGCRHVNFDTEFFVGKQVVIVIPSCMVCC